MQLLPLIFASIFVTMIHVVIIITIFKKRKELTERRERNIVAIYFIYLLIMFGYMFNNLFWNLLNPSVWAEKFLWVYVNPVDNFSALVTASIIRAIFGQMELI